MIHTILTVAFFVLWLAMVLVGGWLIHWSQRHLPPGTVMFSAPVQNRVFTGPYKRLRHPMYLGNTLLITGIGGLGGGGLVAFAFFLLSVTVFGEWAAREDY